MSPAKTAEPIEVPFGLRTRVGPGNHVLDRGPDSPMGRGNFESIGTLCGYVCKTAEPIEVPFGL